MELLAEILLELYADLVTSVLPEKGGKKRLWIARLLAVFAMLGVIALVIWGAVLIGDRGDFRGIIPIAVAVVVALGQIIIGWHLYDKNEKNQKIYQNDKKEDEK